MIQNNLDGREGTAVLGTKRGRSRRLPTPPAPREVASLHSDYNPTTRNPKAKRVFEVVGWGVEKKNAHELQVAEA